MMATAIILKQPIPTIRTTKVKDTTTSTKITSITVAKDISSNNIMVAVVTTTKRESNILCFWEGS